MDIIKKETEPIIKTESQLYKEKRQLLFKEQFEWYDLNSGTYLCDCVNCINARKLKVL